MAKSESRPVRLSAEAAVYVPAAIQSADKLFAVEAERNGKIFISTHTDPNGHICTHVSAEHVIY